MKEAGTFSPVEPHLEHPWFVCLFPGQSFEEHPAEHSQKQLVAGHYHHRPGAVELGVITQHLSHFPPISRSHAPPAVIFPAQPSQPPPERLAVGALHSSQMPRSSLGPGQVSLQALHLHLLPAFRLSLTLHPEQILIRRLDEAAAEDGQFAVGFEAQKQCWKHVAPYDQGLDVEVVCGVEVAAGGGGDAAAEAVALVAEAEAAAVAPYHPGLFHRDLLDPSSARLPPPDPHQRSDQQALYSHRRGQVHPDLPTYAADAVGVVETRHGDAAVAEDAR